jgi:hypothetical protein
MLAPAGTAREGFVHLQRRVTLGAGEGDHVSQDEL